jgi:hypothetical protein
MPYAEYDPLTTLRGLQAVSGMKDARQERKDRALRLQILQKQLDEQERLRLEAEHQRNAAKAAVIPQHATAPQGDVSMSALSAPAQAPIDMSQFALPNGAVRREAPAVAPDVNGVGGDLSVPVGGQQVQGPPAFDRATYLSNISTTDPLLGENEKARYAAQDAAQREAQLKQQKELAGLNKDQLANLASQAELMAREANGVKALPPDQRPAATRASLQRMMQQGALTPQQASAAWSAYQQQGDGFLDQIAQAGVEAKTVYEKAMQQPTEAGLAYTATGTGPGAEHASAALNALAKTKRDSKIVIQNGAGGGGSTAKDIAGAIMAGEQPPTTTGLYRYGAAVRAELAKNHYNLAHAEQDWKAIQKHLSTMNGPAQERLRQAVSFAYGSLDQVESLYGEWKKAAGVSGVKVFNKASLAASKQLPGEAGAIATNLEALINDFTSEMGTVYKGGNSSTDETLRLAAGNLKADWNEETFARAVKQLRQSLTIRKNSYMNSEAIGVTPNSPYAPTQPGGAVDLGAAPAGKAEGSTGTLPDGTKVVIHGGRIIKQ